MVIGIDVGISTTKIVGFSRQEQIVGPIRIKADDPVTSLYGAFGKFLHTNNVGLADVERVMVTGVGSGYIAGNIYGLPTAMVDEFIADGFGARYDVKLDKMIVVSMGTGTSIVLCDGRDIRRLGGLGLGGGTLIGLSRIMLKTGDIAQILELASKGDLKNIDLSIGDISPRPVPSLTMDATASLFGNAASDAKPEDIALGIIWMVLQTIGSATILSSTGTGITDYVMIGNLSLLPQCRQLFPVLEKLFGVHFHIPAHSEFSTAIGAALYFYENQ
ncbi:MAG: type II pantothenate kinase [Prevotella sp.]|nr:type II pantothenate kinase [Prevotella sp.]MCD8305967.1 type II pantothenate kinase [Prevotella sp.]